MRTTLLTPAAGALFRRAREAGLPVEPLSAPALPLLLLTRGAGLCARLRAMDAALLHVHDSGATALGAVCGRRLRVPVVLSRRIASPLRRGWVSRWKYSPRNVCAVIAISETVREALAASGYPAERIAVAPSGLDLDALDAVRPAAELARAGRPQRVAVGVGKLSVKKNWEFLVRAAAALREAAPELEWWVAGEGPERARLERQARELGVAGRVRFLGFRADAQALLKGADLLFFPSLREGASVTVREAMALGTPVVAVNAPGTAESLAGHGWLVEAGDVAGAAAAVRAVLTDAARREAVCRAAQAFAREHYSFGRTLAGTLAVYEQVRGI
jgi:glycosyltransferase involved in cell wall biosynthesis